MRGGISLEDLTDEELNARLQASDEAMLANPKTEDCLRDAIIYEREHGRREGRLIAVLRRLIEKSIVTTQ
jgi:hypothetical protein